MDDETGNTRNVDKSNPIWQYFEVLNEEDCTAICRNCHELFSYKHGDYLLKRHFESKHSDVVSKKSDDEEEEEEHLEATYLEDDDINDDSDSDKRKLRRNGAWDYFVVTDEDQRKAACTLCQEEFSYKTTSTNLSRHLKSKHYIEFKSTDEDVEPQEHETSTRNKTRQSISWEFFTMKDPVKRLATCKICNRNLSYMSSVSNLMKHVHRKHNLEHFDEENDDIDSDEKLIELKSTRNKTRQSISWEFFTMKDPVKRLATCKICNRNFSYMTSVSNLMKHIRRKHNLEHFDEENEGIDSDEKLIELKSPESKMRSPLWLYFKILDKMNRLAMCLICKKRFSFSTSITNLRRHLYRKHPNASLNGSTESKKMLLASNGQLYEIEEPTKQEQPDLDDDEGQHAEPMEIYLDEIEGNVIEKKTVVQPNRKRKNSKMKRTVDEDTDASSCSSNEVTLRKRYVRKTRDSLDQFGLYLVSLLRQLPKDASNRLQADFVKQIMACQNGDSGSYAVAAETQNDLAVSSASNGDIFVVPR